tara:strand:+ start:2776 stop:3075 length:300 start_codon:yes stop_codon:yes gene_type:complete
MDKKHAFILAYIKKVQALSAEKAEGKDGKGYKGAHSVWSGLNTEFKTVFPDADPVETTKAMQEQSLIVIRPWRGGAKLYLTEDQPQSQITREILAELAA